MGVTNTDRQTESIVDNNDSLLGVEINITRTHFETWITVLWRNRRETDEKSNSGKDMATNTEYIISNTYEEVKMEAIRQEQMAEEFIIYLPYDKQTTTEDITHHYYKLISWLLLQENPGELVPVLFFKKQLLLYYVTRNTLDCDQSNYSSHIVFSHIPTEFGQTGISAIRSADPENPTKHEVDRTTPRGDMAIWNFPKCEVGRSVLCRQPSIYTFSYTDAIYSSFLFATLGM